MPHRMCNMTVTQAACYSIMCLLDWFKFVVYLAYDFLKLKSDGAHSSACPSQAWLKVYSAAKNLEKGEVDDKSCRIGGIVTNIR